MAYNFVPTYSLGQHSVGLSVIGHSKAYTQNSNDLAIPAFAYVNGFAKYQISNSLYASLNVNNLFDTLSVTEVEEDIIAEGQGVQYVRGRPILGRSLSLTVGYDF